MDRPYSSARAQSQSRANAQHLWDSSGQHTSPHLEQQQRSGESSQTALTKRPRHLSSFDEREHRQSEDSRGRNSHSPPARRRRVELESENVWGMEMGSWPPEAVSVTQPPGIFSPGVYHALQEGFTRRERDMLGGTMDYAPRDPIGWNLPEPDPYSNPRPDISWYCGSQTIDPSTSTSYPYLQQEWSGQDEPFPRLHGWDAIPVGEGSHGRPVHEQNVETTWNHPGVREGTFTETVLPLTAAETVQSLHRFSDQGGPVQNYGTINNTVNVGNMLTGTNYGTVYMESITVTPPDDFMLNLSDRLKVCIRADHMYYASGDEAALRRGQCTPGTRINILEAVVCWAIDMSLSSELVYWLSGQAGAGKTTIAYTIACLFQTMVVHGNNRAILGGSFFCSRQFSDTRSAASIVCTIVYHLALRSMAFQTALKEHGKFETVNHGPKSQLMGLLVGPWKISAPERLLNNEPCYVVPIDALDELEGTGGTEFLGTLLDVVEDQDLSGLKFFVTSRSHPGLVKRIESFSNKQVCRLEEVPLEESSADIQLYLEKNLSECATTQQIQLLVSSAAGLFIYAATVVEFLKDRDAEEQKHALNGVLTASPSAQRHSRHVTAPLDRLYLQILETCLVDARDRDNPDVFQDCLSILHTFLCTIERTSTSVAINLLNASGGKGETVLNTGIAKGVLTRLHAVLYSQGGQVMSFHKSFTDFLFDKDRSQRFYCNQELQHHRLADGCFGIMTEQLRFNIADIPSSYWLDCDNPALSASIEANISKLLRYACVNWSAHLTLTSIESQDHFTTILNEFLQLRILFWMESMNLLGLRGWCQGILRDAQRCISKSKDTVELVRKLADVVVFAAYHSASKAALSTPHLYVSSLATFSRCSPLVKTWRRQFGAIPGFISAEGVGGEALVSTITVRGGVCSLAVSPDGVHVAIGSFGKSVRILNLSTGEEVGIFRGNTKWVWAVAYSPDGTRVVSGGRMDAASAQVCLWDVRTGEGLRVFEGHTGHSIMALAYSPCETHVASGSDDKSVRVWDISTGKIVSLFQGHTRSVEAVAFSPCGTHVVSGSVDKSVRVWDLSIGEEFSILTGHSNCVNAVAYSPCGTRVVSGSYDRTVRVWDLSTEQEIWVLEGHTREVCAVAYSPDGAHVVSGSRDHSIRVWDLSTGKQMAALEGHTGDVQAVAYSPDGTYVVSGSGDHSVKVWDVSTSKEARPARLLEGHTHPVRAVAYTSDGIAVVSDFDNQSLRVWNLSTGEGKVLEGDTGRIFAVAFSPDGTQAVTGSEDWSVWVWDLSTGEEKRIMEGHTSDIYAVAYSSDGTHVVSGSYDQSVRVWDLFTGEDVKVLEGHTGSVGAVAYSPDGLHIVSGSDDNSVRVWDLSSGEEPRVLRGHTDGVKAVAYSPDGVHVASGSEFDTIRVWNLSTREEVWTLEAHAGSILTLAYSPDGTHLVSGSEDWSVCVWNGATGEVRVLEGHSDCVRTVAYSPDGTRVVSGSYDKSVRVWDVSPGYTPRYIRQKDSDEKYTGWLLSPTEPSAYLMHIPHISLLPDDSNILTIPESAVHHLDLSNAKFGDRWAQCYTPIRF